MRGKTNILPMVGGYINAPIQNETAGEALQLGDLVQRSYSDLPQQIQGSTSFSDVNCFEPLKLFNDKLVYFRQPTTTAVKIGLVEKSVNSFIITEVTLFTVTSQYGAEASFVPISDRMFIVFVRTGYGNTSYPYEYYCKKVVYDGSTFTATDVTYDNFPDIVTGSQGAYYKGWCIGNGGTLFTTKKIYYLTYDSVNDSVSVYGGTENVNSNPHIYYLTDKDLFLSFNNTDYKVITFSNGVLTVTSKTTDISYPVPFGNYVVGYSTRYYASNHYKYNLLIGTVDNSGNITTQDIYETDYTSSNYSGSSSSVGTWGSACIIPFEDYFVFAILYYSSTSALNKIVFRVYYYNNGFVEGDEEEVSQPSGIQAVDKVFAEKISGGIIVDKPSSSSTYGGVAFIFYQGMNGDRFADANSNYTMVKAISKIEGVVKRGGSTGDTIEVFVPQLSS